MKSIWIIILIVVVAGVAYFAYSQGYFAPAPENDSQAGASLDLSIDGTSGFGEE